MLIFKGGITTFFLFFKNEAGNVAGCRYCWGTSSLGEDSDIGYVRPPCVSCNARAYLYSNSLRKSRSRYGLQKVTIVHINVNVVLVAVWSWVHYLNSCGGWQAFSSWPEDVLAGNSPVKPASCWLYNIVTPRWCPNPQIERSWSSFGVTFNPFEIKWNDSLLKNLTTKITKFLAILFKIREIPFIKKLFLSYKIAEPKNDIIIKL